MTRICCLQLQPLAGLISPVPVVFIYLSIYLLISLFSFSASLQVERSLCSLAGWSTVLTVQCSTVLTVQCSTVLTVQCSTVLTVQCSTVLTVQCSTVLTVQCSTVLTVQCSTVLTIECSTVLTVQCSTVLPSCQIVPTPSNSVLWTHFCTVQYCADLLSHSPNPLQLRTLDTHLYSAVLCWLLVT